MTVYAKIENNKLICASNNLGITGLADSPSLCEANGFMAYTEEEISGYFAGTHQIIDGVLTDISQTPEYIEDQKQTKLEVLTGQYTADKCERMISWVSTFISGISTATSLDDIKAKASAFKTKLAALQSDYTTKCTEVENV